MKLAGQRDNLEQVDRSFIPNQLFIKNISHLRDENATEASCYNLLFHGKVFCAAVPVSRKRHTREYLPMVWQRPKTNQGSYMYKYLGCPF